MPECQLLHIPLEQIPTIKLSLFRFRSEVDFLAQISHNRMFWWYFTNLLSLLDNFRNHIFKWTLGGQNSQECFSLVSNVTLEFLLLILQTMGSNSFCIFLFYGPFISCSKYLLSSCFMVDTELKSKEAGWMQVSTGMKEQKSCVHHGPSLGVLKAGPRLVR